MAEIRFPSLLAQWAGGIRRWEGDGTTVEDLIAHVDRQFPGFRERLCDGNRLRPIYKLVVDGRIAFGGLETPIGPDSVVDILPSFGGG